MQLAKDILIKINKKIRLLKVYQLASGVSFLNNLKMSAK